MPKRRIVVILLGLTGLLVLLVVVLTRDYEPIHDGHTLSYWLQRHQKSVKARPTNTDQPDESQKAILAIGTNAIPWLLKWIRYEPNPVPQFVLNRVQWSFWNTRIGGRIMFGSGRRNSRAEAVVHAFGILGTNAAPAINALVIMMRDNSHPMASNRAMMALGCLGQCAFTPLAQALTNPKQRERQLVALELFELSHDPAIGTNKILPLVINCAQDPDPTLRNYARDFLAKIPPPGYTNSTAQ